MASTGVRVDDDVVSQFNDLKLKKINAKFIIYKIDNGKIVTDIVGPSVLNSFEDFSSNLPRNDGRYAIYDCDFTANDGRPGNKLVSIAWIPDTAPVRKKMVYAGSKDALSSALVGIMVKLQATDASELDEERIKTECTRYAV